MKRNEGWWKPKVGDRVGGKEDLIDGEGDLSGDGEDDKRAFTDRNLYREYGKTKSNKNRRQRRNWREW